MSQPEGAWFADKEAADKAVNMALPMIEKAMQDPAVGESGFLYIVVMDPARPYGSAPFEDAILYEHALGDRETWDADYARFARDKARISWRTGRDGHSVRAISPYLLSSGDAGIWGSVCHDGIVVGVSGANPWYDEAFASCVAACLKSVAKARAMAAAETPFLNGEHRG